MPERKIKISYDKPALTIKEQIERLEKRGLRINNLENANYILSNLSYYRFSGYLYPFLKEPKKEHLFKENSSFESAFDIYRFDRDLKMLIFYEIEKIEIAIRTQIIYILSHEYGPFWFENENLFFNGKHKILYEKIVKEWSRSDEKFIKNFKESYTNLNPPSWMTLEVLSFGTISQLYKLLRNSRIKRDIANHFGLSEKVFESWIHSLVYLRNIIAHHSRLWNKEFRINPIIPNSPKLNWLSSCHILSKGQQKKDYNQIKNDKVYFMISIIAYLLQTINPETKFKSKIKSLLNEYENIDIFSMGFNSDWISENLWK